ncbi:MAG: AAA family ATPase [Acidobacteriota bacterium]
MERIRLRSFRNLADGQVEWGRGLNLISGENGQGKTNLLEAVFFLAMGWTFRGTGRPALALSSARLELFHGGPAARRRFVDRGVVGQNPLVLTASRWPAVLIFRGWRDSHPDAATRRSGPRRATRPRLPARFRTAGCGRR